MREKAGDEKEIEIAHLSGEKGVGSRGARYLQPHAMREKSARLQSPLQEDGARVEVSFPIAHHATHVHRWLQGRLGEWEGLREPVGVADSSA